MKRISTLEREPKDTGGQEKSKVIIEKGESHNKKSTTGDVLDHLRKMVSSDDFRESPSPEPRQSNQLPGKSSSFSSQGNVEEAAAKMIKSIFQCPQFVLVNVNYHQQHVPLVIPVIVCVHCLEQWIESSTSLSKCPLCQTSADYAVIPLVQEIANILGQSVPRSNIEAENDASDTDIIPHGVYHSDDDFDLATVS